MVGDTSPAAGASSSAADQAGVAACVTTAAAGQPGASVRAPPAGAGQPRAYAGAPPAGAVQPGSSAGALPARAGLPGAAAGVSPAAVGQPGAAAIIPTAAAGHLGAEAGVSTAAGGQPVAAAVIPTAAAGQPKAAARVPTAPAGQPGSAGVAFTAAEAQPCATAGALKAAAGQHGPATGVAINAGVVRPGDDYWDILGPGSDLTNFPPCVQVQDATGSQVADDAPRSAAGGVQPEASAHVAPARPSGHALHRPNLLFHGSGHPTASVHLPLSSHGPGMQDPPAFLVAAEALDTSSILPGHTSSAPCGTLQSMLSGFAQPSQQVLPSPAASSSFMPSTQVGEEEEAASKGFTGVLKSPRAALAAPSAAPGGPLTAPATLLAAPCGPLIAPCCCLPCALHCPASPYSACRATVASLRVLAFDHEGRPLRFDKWLDDLQMYLLSDSRDSVSLFDHASGTDPTPPATADSATCSQWLTRNAAARLAIRNHLPLAECSTGQHRHFRDHFLALDPTDLTVDLLEQHLLAAETSVVIVGATRGTPRTPFFEGCSHSPLAPSYASAATVEVPSAEDVGAAFASAKRRSSKGKGGRGGGGGNRSGGGGSSGGGGGSGGGGSGGSGGGSGGFGGGGGGSGGSGGSGSGGSGGGRTGAQRGGYGGGHTQRQKRRSETPSPQQLREWLFQRGASGGSGSCPYIIRTGDRAGQTCGKPHTQHYCFSRLNDAWRAEFDYDAILAAMYALSVSAEGDCYQCVPPDPGIEAASLGASESSLSSTAPAKALHTIMLDSGFDGHYHHSDLLRDFFRGEGILQSFTLPDSPQQNGIAERRIGLVMELNLWPRVSFPETFPTLRWTGKVGDASVFRVWGSRAIVRNTAANKLSARTIPSVFLGFLPDAPGWQFCHPTSRRVFPSHDVTFDEPVPFYRLFPYRSAPPLPPPLFLAPGPPPVDPFPPQGPAPSGVSQVDALPGVVPVEVAGDLGAARGGASGGVGPGGAEGAGSGGAKPGCAEPEGAEPTGVATGGAEPEVVEPGGAESEGAESGGAEPWGAASSGGLAGSSPRLSPRPDHLSPQQLREWLVRSARLRSGDTGARGAGVTTRAGGTRGARTRGIGAAGIGGVGGAGARDPTEPGAAGTGGAGAGGTCAGGAGAGGTGACGAGAGGLVAGGARAGGAGAGGAGAGGAGAVDPGAGGAGGTGAGGTVRPRPFFVPLLQKGVPSSTALTPPLLCPLPDQSQPPLHPTSPLLAPSPYSQHTGGLTERREPTSCPASPVCTSRRVPRPRPPPVPGTHAMALRPSSVPLPPPPESSLPAVPDLESDRARVASPTVSCLLKTVVTDPYFESTAACALVAQLVDFAAACRLDYATTLIPESEDMQEDLECLATAVPCFASMLLALEGDPDAPDIPTPRSYAEAITDASWVDDSATQRSSQGYTFNLGSGSDSRRSTRSSLALCFSSEAEIYAGAMATQELCWLTYLLTDLGEHPRSPQVLYVDNKAMIALCLEHRLEHRTKRIALRYFLAQELQQRGQLCLAYVATRANLVDIFTKALPLGDHQRFSTVLGLMLCLTCSLRDFSCTVFYMYTCMLTLARRDRAVLPHPQSHCPALPAITLPCPARNRAACCLAHCPPAIALPAHKRHCAPASSLRLACTLPARTPPTLTRTLPAPCPSALMRAAAVVTYAAATAACAAATAAKRAAAGHCCQTRCYRLSCCCRLRCCCHLCCCCCRLCCCCHLCCFC
ncbi:unnamed protein product [Closterium sp. NIES-54]